MKITEIEIIKVPPSWVWIYIKTDTELFGIGEPYLENHADTVIAEVKRLEPLLIGKDSTQVEKIWKIMYESGTGYVGGPIKMSAISGIDIALWDLAGKAAKVPIYKMFGGSIKNKIKLYRALGGELPWTVKPGEPYSYGKNTNNKFSSNEPETYRESAKILTKEWGFKTLKMHISVGEGLEATSKVDEIVERFIAAREGAGPNIDIAIDIHNPHPSIGRQLVESLSPYRPLFIEEPMPPERVDYLKKISNEGNATIAAGERWMGKWIFFDALSKGYISVMQPDICHAGGITETKKIAIIGEATHAKLAIHCPLSIVALAASIQVDACSNNFLVQEHNEVNDSRENNLTTIGKGYIKDPFILDNNGEVEIPEKPGLGIEINEKGMNEIMSKKWSSTRG